MPRSLIETRLPRTGPDPGGRPSKYTAPAVLRIVLALASGAERPDAARVGGVASSTLYEWLKLGRSDPDHAPLVLAVRLAERIGQAERKARRRRKRRARRLSGANDL